MSLDRAIVVDPQERNRVLDVLLVLEPAGCVPGPAREDRVVVDPPLVVELVPDRLREPDVERTIAVQVAELTPSRA